MYEQKTKENSASVQKFIGAIADENKRKDCTALIKLFEQVMKTKAKMWGTAIVGFGSYHYKYASGHEGDSCLAGFSPRKQNITLYLMGGFHAEKSLMEKLGKYKTGKGCLYINRLADVDVAVLKKVITVSVAKTKEYVKKVSKEKK